MEKQFVIRTLAAVCGLLIGGTTWGHVPYLEDADFSGEAPFRVKNIPQSKAMYAWLSGPSDVDHYAMQVDEPTRIYMHTNIPYCKEYADFTVTYALTGPGLPAPDANMPVTLPAGHGAIIVRDQSSKDDDRPVMYEPFSGRMYWEGPVFDIEVDAPGDYQMVVWHEGGASGDYVAVIGKKEIFGPTDIWRALTKTPGIRAGKELHTSCTVDESESDIRA